MGNPTPRTIIEPDIPITAAVGGNRNAAFTIHDRPGKLGDREWGPDLFLYGDGLVMVAKQCRFFPGIEKDEAGACPLARDCHGPRAGVPHMVQIQCADGVTIL